MPEAELRKEQRQFADWGRANRPLSSQLAARPCPAVEVAVFNHASDLTTR